MSAQPARPPGPRGRWLTGVAGDYARDALGLLERSARFGDISFLRFGPVRAFLLNHPDLIEQALVTDYRKYVKGLAIRRNRILFGNGLLSSEGDFWRRQRRLAQPAFHRDRIAAYARTMVEAAEQRAAGWRDGEVRDIHEEMTRITLVIAAKTLFSSEVSDEAESVGESLNQAQDALQRRMSSFLLLNLPERLPVPANLRLMRAVRRLDELVYRIIDERRRSGEDRGDLLSVLLQAQDEDDGGRMTDRQLRDEVVTLFVAGFETTALALTWTLYLLAQRPEVESRLAEEIESVLGGRAPRAEDRPSLQFTERVALESMRLYPPAWAVARTAVEPAEIGGYTVRPGSVVVASQWVTHRDPRWFPDPERFDPDRWAGQPAPPKYAYFPFGGGPRVCIGNQFAMMEAVMILAALCRHWRFALAASAPVELQPAITLRPRGGIAMRLVSRESSGYGRIRHAG